MTEIKSNFPFIKSNFDKKKEAYENKDCISIKI